MAKKSRKSTQKWYFLLVGKHSKIYNLATTNAILMRLTTIMYLHETFHFVKNWGVTHSAWEGVVQKHLKTIHKIKFLG